MLRDLAGGRTKASSKNFEIKLDSPFVVFHGDAYDAEAVELSGTLCLSNLEQMSVRSIKIRLRGKWNISWFVEPAVSPIHVRDKGTTIDQELVLYPTEVAASNATSKIAPGYHEWRFTFVLNPVIPESVEGLEGNFIVYDLKAEIERGFYSKNLSCEKHVRVIRTLGRDMAETVPMPYSNEDTWKDKLWYHIYVPSRKFIFGTSITAEFMLCPLHKGISIGKIKMEVLERIQLTTCEGRFNQNSREKVVATHEQEMPEDTTTVDPEEMAGLIGDSSQIEFDECFKFKVTLPLAMSLNRARQSVDTDHLKIFHFLKIYVNLHNPDGHISQLLVRNIIHVYISPNLPVGDDQTIQANASQVAQLLRVNDGGTLEAPPTYGEHRLDQLYDDIDPNTFLSGANTPIMLSRPTSAEYPQSSMDTITLNNTAANSHLHSRLEALPLSGEEAVREDGSENDILTHTSSPASTYARSNSFSLSVEAASRRGSYQQYLHPNHNPTSANNPTIVGYFPALAANGRFDMEALARTPSYNTAVQTPAVTPPATRNSCPSYGLLPTYETAVSGRNSLAVSPLRLLPTAHMRHNRGHSDISGHNRFRFEPLIAPPIHSLRPHSASVRSS